MSLTKDDMHGIREVFNEGLETLVLPRFDAIESRMDGLETRIDGLETRMDGLEKRTSSQVKATTDLRDEMRAGFVQVNGRLSEINDRLGSIEEDIRQLYRDVDNIKATHTDEGHVKLSVNERVLRLYGEITAIAKEAGIKLPR